MGTRHGVQEASRVKGMLFDTSPLDDDPPKKKSRKKPEPQPACVASPEPVAEPQPAEFLATAVVEARCPACDTPGDIDIEHKGRWRCVCGWSCGLAWWQPAVAGVVEKASAERAERDPGQYVVLSGFYRDKTLQELWDAGRRVYIESVASNGKSTADREAAKRFLARVG
jgi:hypothetical protein